MESGRMPLPATRLTVPDVGATRDQGSGIVPRPHAQIGRLFRRCQPVQRKVCSLCDTFNAQTFETFLKKLLRHRSRGKRMVVLDNARYHHAILLTPLLRKYRKVLTLLFLPPYSPQLAPVERVWKLARRMATHNRFFPTLSDVLVAVETCFDRWQKPNSILRRLCGII